jgi:hypothetical protein
MNALTIRIVYILCNKHEWVNLTSSVKPCHSREVKGSRSIEVRT